MLTVHVCIVPLFDRAAREEDTRYGNRSLEDPKTVRPIFELFVKLHDRLLILTNNSKITRKVLGSHHDVLPWQFTCLEETRMDQREHRAIRIDRHSPTRMLRHLSLQGFSEPIH